jgi:hypothetical protein
VSLAVKETCGGVTRLTAGERPNTTEVPDAAKRACDGVPGGDLGGGDLDARGGEGAGDTAGDQTDFDR